MSAPEVKLSPVRLFQRESETIPPGERGASEPRGHLEHKDRGRGIFPQRDIYTGSPRLRPDKSIRREGELHVCSPNREPPGERAGQEQQILQQDGADSEGQQRDEQ